MLSLYTRTKNSDYRCFGSDISYWWKNYKESFDSADTNETEIYIEIEKENWRAYIGRFDSNREDVYGRKIYWDLRAEGERGDEDSVGIFKLVSALLRKSSRPLQAVDISSAKSEIGEKFDSIFTEEVIEGLGTKERLEVISELHEFYKSLKTYETGNITEIQISKGGLADYLDYESQKREKFLQLANFLTNKKGIPVGMISLVCTSSELTEKNIEKASASLGDNFSGLFLTLVRRGVPENNLPYTFSKSINEKSGTKDKEHKDFFLKRFRLAALIYAVVLTVYMHWDNGGEISSLARRKSKIRNELVQAKSEIENLKKSSEYNGTWESADKKLQLQISGDMYVLKGFHSRMVIGRMSRDNGAFNLSCDFLSDTLEEEAKKQEVSEGDLHKKYDKIFEYDMKSDSIILKGSKENIRLNRK